MKSVASTRNKARWHGAHRNWETPLEVFDPLNREFAFTLDPCATKRTAKVERYFNERDNGLRRSWGKHRVFMNPPYGREIPAWTSKAVRAARAGALVVALLPASVDLEWWHRDVIPFAEIRWMRGRPMFLDPTSRRRVNAFAPSCIIIWRPGLT